MKLIDSVAGEKACFAAYGFIVVKGSMLNIDHACVTHGGFVCDGIARGGGRFAFECALWLVFCMIDTYGRARQERRNAASEIEYLAWPDPSSEAIALYAASKKALAVKAYRDEVGDISIGHAVRRLKALQTGKISP